MPIPGAPYTAGGNIAPARFVKISTAADHTILQAGAGDKAIGVTHKGVRNAPYSSLNDGYAAIAGESGFRVFFEGEVCHLELGTGGATAGDRLKSDTNGKGVAVASDEDWYGAEALETGSAGDVILVRVVTGYYAVA